MMKAQIIQVSIRTGERGLYFATSPDLKGLHLAMTDLDRLLVEVPKMIEALFAARGIKVDVHEVEHSQRDVIPWVAVPVERVLQRAG